MLHTTRLTYVNNVDVYFYYEITQGWSRATTKAQVIDPFNDDDTSNFSDLDLLSIMM